MRRKLAVLLMGLGVMAGGCNRGEQRQAAAKPAGPQMKLAPPTPIAEKKVELGDQSWNPQWDRYVEEALPAQLLSAKAGRDVRQYCPRFNTLAEADKRAFWAYFFQALAGAEAGLKPTTDVQHTEPEIAVKDDVTKRMVRSEGLLQLTYEDAKRYDCDFDWDRDKLLAEHDPAKTILQPKNNLQCGVKILTNQLIDQGKPLLSRTSYWSTLQPQRPSFRVFAKQMTNVPAACRAPAAVRHTASRRAEMNEAASVSTVPLQ